MKRGKNPGNEKRRKRSPQQPTRELLARIKNPFSKKTVTGSLEAKSAWDEKRESNWRWEKKEKEEKGKTKGGVDLGGKHAPKTSRLKRTET